MASSTYFIVHANGTEITEVKSDIKHFGEVEDGPIKVALISGAAHVYVGTQGATVKAAIQDNGTLRVRYGTKRRVYGPGAWAYVDGLPDAPEGRGRATVL